MSFDVEKIRADFPVLQRRFDGKPLAYLDNAASTQKPQAVIDAVCSFYARQYANVHRSVYTLGMEATEQFEAARQSIATYAGGKPDEIILTRNATESINLVAYAWGESHIQTGDAIVVTEMDHHSNLVPWQQLALRKKAQLHFVPVTSSGELDASFEFPENTKVFAFPHVSNVLGSINDVTTWTKKAKNAGATVLVDGAAGAPHFAPQATTSGADFYALSGHKMLGPMGSGILWTKREVLEQMPPFLFGGSMIATVTKEKSAWSQGTQKFEAGTPDAADAIGLAAAVDYIHSIGLETIGRHEQELLQKTLSLLSEINEVAVYGNAKNRVATVSFNVDGVHAHDVGSILDSEAIAVRTGHHCTQVLMKRLGQVATTRASFYLYNTESEVDRLADGIKKVIRTFK